MVLPVFSLQTDGPNIPNGSSRLLSYQRFSVKVPNFNLFAMYSVLKLQLLLIEGSIRFRKKSCPD